MIRKSDHSVLWGATMALRGSKQFAVGDSVIQMGDGIFSPCGKRIPCGSKGEIIHRCDDGSLLAKFAGDLGYAVVYPRQLRPAAALEVGQTGVSTASLQAQAGPDSRSSNDMPLSALRQRQRVFDNATPLRNLARQDDDLPLSLMAGRRRVVARERSCSSSSNSSIDSNRASDDHQTAAQKLEAEGSEEAARRVASMDADEAAEILAEMEDCSAADIIQEISENNKSAKIVSELDVHKAGQVLWLMCEFKAAEIVAEMECERAAEVMCVMEAFTASQILSKMMIDDEVKAAQIMDQMDSDEAAQIFDDMDQHERADILVLMDPHQAAGVLTKMDEYDAGEVLTSYPWKGPSIAAVLSEMASEKARALVQRIHDEDCWALEDVFSDMDSDKAVDILSHMEDTSSHLFYGMEGDKLAKILKIIANPKLSIAKAAALFCYDAVDALAKTDAERADAIRRHITAKHMVEHMADEAPELLAKMEDVEKAAAILETIESIGGDQAVSIVQKLGEKRTAILPDAREHKRRRTV